MRDWTSLEGGLLQPGTLAGGAEDGVTGGWRLAGHEGARFRDGTRRWQEVKTAKSLEPGGTDLPLEHPVCSSHSLLPFHPATVVGNNVPRTGWGGGRLHEIMEMVICRSKMLCK